MKKTERTVFLDLKRQYKGIRKAIDRAVADVLSSGWYILGERVAGFEQEFSCYCGTDFGISVASGTDALYISLCALGIGRGDEVITVANAGVPITAAITLSGAKPVFVDVDPTTFNIDPLRVRNGITGKTKAIIPVHLYGRCADMGPLADIARKYGLRVIEDACQAHGAEYKGKKAGSIGDIGCFSFYPTKNLGCYGDGGIIVTDDRRLAEKARLLRDYGQVSRYVHRMKGTNSRLDEIQAALLSVKLKHLDRWNRVRIEIAEKYEMNIHNEFITKPEFLDDGSHVYHLYVVRSKERDALRRHLKKKGIETNIHYPFPVYLQKAYSEFRPEGGCPVSEKLSRSVLSLPLYPELKEEETSRICSALNSFKGKG